MDTDAYKKLVKEFISGLQRIEGQPEKFLALVDEKKQKFLKTFGEVTFEDVQRDIDIEELALNIRIRNLLFRRGIRKLGGVADLTENQLTIILNRHKEDIKEIKAMLKKHKLSLRRG